MTFNNNTNASNHNSSRVYNNEDNNSKFNIAEIWNNYPHEKFQNPQNEQ